MWALGIIGPALLLLQGADATGLRSARASAAPTSYAEDVVIPISLVEEDSGAQGRGGDRQRYDPDLTLQALLQSDSKHHGHKVEGMVDALATGTSEMLYALAEHHGVSGRLKGLASAHHGDEERTRALIESSLLETHLREHGLAHHRMDTISSTVGAMTHRVFQKIHANSSPPTSTVTCPKKPEVDEKEGGATVLADAITGETTKYQNPSVGADIEEPNLDPSAESSWQDVGRLQSADTTAELVREKLSFLENEKSEKYQKLLQRFDQSSSRTEVQEVLDQMTIGMDLELGPEESQDLIVEKLDFIGELFNSDDQNERDPLTGARAIEQLVDVLQLILDEAEKLRSEIATHNPPALKLYEDELARVSEGDMYDDADEPGTGPLSRRVFDRSKATVGRVPPSQSLGEKIKNLFKAEWASLKEQAGPVVALLSFFKISVGWSLPVTFSDLMNPKLPDLGIVCQPIAPCITHMKNAGAAVMRAIWTILTLPLKVLWIVVKSILEKIGGGILKRISSLFVKPQSEETNELEGALSGAKSGSSAASKPPETVKSGFSGPPISSETTTLVPISESSGASWSSCKLCNLRLQFIFALALSDCIVGFGLGAFKVKLSTVPQTAPTLFKCASSCIKLALSAIRLTSEKKQLEKTYWQETCTPHSVGMCMFNARVTQCSSVWGNSEPSNPLSVFVKAAGAKRDQMHNGISSINMCSTIPDSVTVAVARSRAGELICPADAIEAYAEWKDYKMSGVHEVKPPDMCNTKQFAKEEAKCENMGCSKQVFSKGQCATMSLRRGCELVREKMIIDEKNNIKMCGKNSGAEWGSQASFTDTNMAQVDVIFEKCMSLMKCAKPNDVGGPGGAGGLGDGVAGTAGSAKKMVPSTVLKMIKRHMDSMDYLSDHPVGTLKSAKEASLALFKDLQKAMEADTLFTEQKAIETSTCLHDWKLSSTGLWKHPLWSSNCIIWERPPSKGTKYDIINGLLNFTTNGNTAQQARETMSSKLLGSLATSRAALDQNAKARSISRLDDFLGLKVKEIAENELKSGDRRQLCQPNSKGLDPKVCTYLSSLGTPPLPLRSGAVVNRGLILADAFGISRTNAKWCVCDCCKKIFGQEPASLNSRTDNICRVVTAGHFQIADENQCSPESCSLRFPEKCPRKIDLKAKTGVNQAKIEDHSNSALTCEQVRDEPLTNSEHLEKSILFWLKKHRNQRAFQTTCNRDIVSSNMAKTLESFVDANPGYQMGQEPMKVSVLSTADADKAARAAQAAETDIASKRDEASPQTSLLLEIQMKYEPSPAKGARAGWTEARCLKCCSTDGRALSYKGESEDPSQMRSCGKGGAILSERTGGSKATEEMCKACIVSSGSLAGQSASEKMTDILNEEISNVEKTAAGTRPIAGSDEKPIVVIRACSLSERPMPNVGIGNSLYVAFPSTKKTSVGMALQFKVIRRPFAALNSKTQKLNYCIIATTPTSRIKPWTPAESSMINAVRDKSMRTLPYAFSPKEVASASGSPLPTLSEKFDGEIEIICEDMKSQPGWNLSQAKMDTAKLKNLLANQDTRASRVIVTPLLRQ